MKFEYQVATFGGVFGTYLQLQAAKNALPVIQQRHGKISLADDFHITRVRHLDRQRRQYDVLLNGRWVPESKAMMMKVES